METKTPQDADFTARRAHLAGMTDAELKDYFWSLTDRTVAPLIELARTKTTPSIERSVLLRMGFSDAEAKALVDQVIARGLIGKGAGHVVFRLAKLASIDVRAAGLRLLGDQGWPQVLASFGRKP